MVKASMLLSVNRADVLRDMTFKFSSWNKAGKLEPSTNNEVAQGFGHWAPAYSLTHGRPKP